MERFSRIRCTSRYCFASASFAPVEESAILSEYQYAVTFITSENATAAYKMATLPYTCETTQPSAMTTTRNPVIKNQVLRMFFPRSVYNDAISMLCFDVRAECVRS